jgi:uncharacterized protein (DUF1501 family)
MLDFMYGPTARMCDGVPRRTFLKVGALGGLGVSLPQLFQQQALAASKSGSTSDKDLNCIFIWAMGGMSHIDTLDPKPEAAPSVRGPFSAINTATPGVQFSEICPRLAQEQQRFALMRSWNPKNNNHGTADAYCNSGHAPNPALRHPCYGSVVSHTKGFKNTLPPFIQLGNFIDRSSHAGTAGFLPAEFNPFEINADPSKADFRVRDITPPAGIQSSRIQRRRDMLGVVDQLQRKADLQPAAFDVLDEHYKAALNLITAPETKRAFDLSSESPKLRDGYGRTRFGQSCLLARRLIESGVRFVTVTDGSWDHHTKQFDNLQLYSMPPLDKGLPALLIDLEERGLLETTLVVVMTDFGRTPKINSAAGRDHWGSAGTVIMAGAGVPGGSVLGATDDEAAQIIRNPYLTEDVAATLYTKIGVRPDQMLQSSDGRPVRLNEGHLIREWM